MGVTERPKPPPKPPVDEAEVARFLAGGAPTASAAAPVLTVVPQTVQAPEPEPAPAQPPKQTRKKRPYTPKMDLEVIAVRFEPNVIQMIDDKAAAMGISRSAWLRMIAARDLGLTT